MLHWIDAAENDTDLSCHAWLFSVRWTDKNNIIKDTLINSTGALSRLSPPDCVEAHPKGQTLRRQHSSAMPLRFSLPDGNFIDSSSGSVNQCLLN